MMNEQTTTNLALDKSFDAECANLMALHTRKNHDYGNTFGDLFQDFMKRDKTHAMIYAIGHLKEKVNRLHQVAIGGNMVNQESAEDSLMDLASYALMTLAELHRNAN